MTFLSKTDFLHSKVLFFKQFCISKMVALINFVLFFLLHSVYSNKEWFWAIGGVEPRSLLIRDPWFDPNSIWIKSSGIELDGFNALCLVLELLPSPPTEARVAFFVCPGNRKKRVTSNFEPCSYHLFFTINSIKHRHHHSIADLVNIFRLPFHCKQIRHFYCNTSLDHDLHRTAPKQMKRHSFIFWKYRTKLQVALFDLEPDGIQGLYFGSISCSIRSQVCF